jgi:hypothetical protein
MGQAAAQLIYTFNAEEDRPMQAVNEAVGFTPAGVEGAWRKELWADLSGRRAAGGAVLRAAALRGGLPLPCWPSVVGVGSPAEAAVPVQRRHVLPSGHPPWL